MDLMRTFTALLLVIVSNCLTAGTVTDLYRAKLSVPNQVQSPSDEHLRAGLKQVLVKVSGSNELNRNPLVQQQLPAASSFLQQFGFEAGLDNAESQTLLLDFNQVSVDALINQTGVKPLGVSRPTVLFWIATDKDGVQDYVMPGDPIQVVIDQAARKRAIPLQLPLLDLADQIALPVTDLWGLFQQSIATASERYRPDAIVAVRLTSTPSGMAQTEWSMTSPSGQQRFSNVGQRDQLLAELVDRVADQLFQPVVSHDLSYFQTGVAVRVAQVDSLSDYIQLTEFLQSLPVVSQVKPEKVMGTDVTVRLELDGSEMQLQQAISVEPRLQATDMLMNPDGSKTLSYRWQG